MNVKMKKESTYLRMIGEIIKILINSLEEEKRVYYEYKGNNYAMFIFENYNLEMISELAQIFNIKYNAPSIDGNYLRKNKDNTLTLMVNLKENWISLKPQEIKNKITLLKIMTDAIKKMKKAIAK